MTTLVRQRTMVRMATRYGRSTRAGTTFTDEELAEKGVEKIRIYAKLPTSRGLDALMARWGLGSRSAVVAQMTADALKREKIKIDE